MRKAAAVTGKALSWIGKILLVGVLFVGNFVGNCIGALICAITN